MEIYQVYVDYTINGEEPNIGNIKVFSFEMKALNLEDANNRAFDEFTKKAKKESINYDYVYVWEITHDDKIIC